MRKRSLAILTAMIALSTCTSIASLAAWNNDGKGWSWQENGQKVKNVWKWIDGDGDGTAECYYFDSNGYLLSNTTTPDGYFVNVAGAWVPTSGTASSTDSNSANTSGGPGVAISNAQAADTTKNMTSTADTSAVPSLEAASVAQAQATSTVKKNANWVNDGNGWKFKKDNGGYVTNTIWLIDENGAGIYYVYGFDENGYLLDSAASSSKAWGQDKFGIHDIEGRQLTIHYKGETNQKSSSYIGPYEVIKKSGSWHCINGTINLANTYCCLASNDPGTDAAKVVSAIDNKTITSYHRQ